MGKIAAIEAKPVAAPRAATTWWIGWGPLVVLPAAPILVVPPTWPRWVLMWTMALAIYGGCKWLTWHRTSVAGAPFWLHAGYLFGWPGLDAAAFLNRPSPSAHRKPDIKEWLFAGSKLGAGLGLLYVGARAIPPSLPYLVGW